MGDKIIKWNYNRKRPIVAFRADLPKEILEFIKELKGKNKGSKWLNEAVKEKYEKDGIY